MHHEIVASERARFEGLGPSEAKTILERMEGKTPTMRSCWYCNGAHEHLKSYDDTPIMCFACGGWYLNGYPAPIVAIRARGEAITDEAMAQVVEYTTESD